MDKPIIRINSRGETGNIFWILGAARVTLRRLARLKDYDEMRERVIASASYEEALAIIREYVDLIDDDGEV